MEELKKFDEQFPESLPSADFDLDSAGNVSVMSCMLQTVSSIACRFALLQTYYM